ncbi:MAG: NTP transferase domain-containing protein [Spirochaetaceae bacterium]|nr:NTP transferase domain-containing protein [Spirochaetaceae bacterium]
MSATKKPILIVLAAGMGSRYGGLKQMDKIGAGGEALLDYSVFDALRAGFGKVVFVIRHDIERDFREIVLARMGARVPSEIAFQELDRLIPPEIARTINRTKPWGTTHALLCAGDKIDAPFAVINADDFYGKEAYEVMAQYLSGNPIDGAIVPYRLSQVLSLSGTVTRGICEVEDGCLKSVNELLKIQREGDGIYNTNPDGTKLKLAPDTPASMNFFGYPESIMPHFQQYFDEFLHAHSSEEKSECYLPLAADSFIKSGKTVIRILSADSEWFGVTYKEDREAAAMRVAQLTQEGIYPSKLWG